MGLATAGAVRLLAALALTPWSHPLGFQSLPGWHTGASGMTPSAYLGPNKHPAAMESAAWIAKNVRYQDAATADPPNKTLADLPPDGVIVWAVIYQSGQHQQPFSLDLDKARHLSCCEGVSVAGGDDELTGSGPNGDYSVIIRVYFGSPPTAASRKQAQAALNKLQLPDP
jgi:hypothetical protein